MLKRAITRRCPQCGAETLFRGYARLRPDCPACGLRFRREQGAQTGSMYVSAVVTELFAAFLIAVLWLCFDWSTARFIGVSVPLVLVFSLAALPLSQALWVGIEYVTDLEAGEPWARLRE